MEEIIKRFNKEIRRIGGFQITLDGACKRPGDPIGHTGTLGISGGDYVPVLGVNEKLSFVLEDLKANLDDLEKRIYDVLVWGVRTKP